MERSAKGEKMQSVREMGGETIDAKPSSFGKEL